MHARELIELAALASFHGPVLIRGTEPISEANLERYWIASKSRLDRWGRALKQISNSADHPAGKPHRPQRPPIRGLLEEILTGEVLTRVWTAVMCAYDRHHGTEASEPVVRSVLIGHLEARHRVLTLLVQGPGIDAEEALKLNRLRRRTERWTDLLVGHLAGLHDVGEFAIDPRRARDFAEDLRWQSRRQGGRYVWPLALASLEAAFRQGLAPVSPNPDLNATIAQSILACFQPELFDSTGVFRSAWLMRLANAANDAQGMIDELLTLEGARSPGGSTRGQAADRSRRFGN